MFVGAVSDNFDERIEQKIFHAEIVTVSAEMKAYQPIPIIAEFINEDGSDNLRETIEANYKRVKQEVLSLNRNRNRAHQNKSIFKLPHKRIAYISRINSLD